MTPEQMNRRLAVLERRAAKIDREIRDIQEACPHPDAISVARSNTGNFDPSHDCYWTEFLCPHCGKQWDLIR